MEPKNKSLFENEKLFNFTPNNGFFKKCNSISFNHFIVIPLYLNKKSSSPDNRCSICLLPISKSVRLDKCKHEFCLTCISKWSKFHKNCPLCRCSFSKIIANEDFHKYIYINNTDNENFISNETKVPPSSQKMPKILICLICQKNGTPSSIFTCFICKSYTVHYWCEEKKFFKLGIYICPACQNLRNNRLNEI